MARYIQATWHDGRVVNHSGASVNAAEVLTSLNRAIQLLRAAIQQEEHNTCVDGEKMPWITESRIWLESMK